MPGRSAPSSGGRYSQVFTPLQKIGRGRQRPIRYGDGGTRELYRGYAT